MMRECRVSVAIILLLTLGGAAGQHRQVDFRFAPENYFTAICLPDDWQKTLVSEQGALAYDFGPGPYAKPLTEINVGIKGKEPRVNRQYLQDSRVPIVTTEL